MRPARQAGSSEAASVSTVPMRRAMTIEPDDRDGPASDTGPDEPTHDRAATARPIPATTPATEPATPKASACSITSPITCERVVPAARSRPTSRVSSATVIDRVLKIRKAPAKRTTAATSRSALRKSAISLRREAARSSVRDSRYGWLLMLASSWPMSSSTDVPGTAPRSTRVTLSVPNSVWADGRVKKTSRPSASGSGPLPITMPTTS